jgi:transposase
MLEKTHSGGSVMGYIQGDDRRQQFLLPPSIDEYVDESSPVRVLDAFVDGLDLEALSFTRSTPASTGRSGYDPRDLLKLYVYGYANQIRSSRRLMRECRRNLEVIFLLRGLVPDFRTIADFRKENAEALKRVFQVFTKVCVELDLYKQVLLAVDGTKIRAVNSKANCYTTDVLLKKIATIDAHISNYMAAMDELDQTEEDETTYTCERLQEILDDFHARKERYEGYVEDLKESGEKQLLTTDPDARRMHSKDGFHCSYNIQTAVDSENHLICAYEVTNHNTDQGLLNDLCQEAKTALDTPVVEVVADKGYESRRDILDCLMNGNIPHVALKYDKDARVFSLPYREADITDALRARTDPEAIRTCLHAGVLPLAYEDKGISIEVQSGSEVSCFLRHADGTVTCPTGHTLTQVKQRRGGGYVYQNRDACRQCRVRCTTAKVKEVYFGPTTECVAVRVRGRSDLPLQALPEGFVPNNSFYRKDHDDAVVVITISQDTEKLRTRKSTVEHPFGTIKWYHGAHFALLKGKTKVAAEYALSFLAYNMNRVMKIVGTDALFDLFSDKKRMYELCRLVQ